MGPIVAPAPEATKNAMEHDITEHCQPRTSQDGTVAGEQPMVIASGWK